MRKILIGLFFVCVLVFFQFSCFQPEDYFADINATPVFFILNVMDSVKSITSKFKLNAANDHYTVNFILHDDQDNKIFMEQVSGAGVFQSNMDKKTFSYYPSQYGFHSFDVVCLDPYGLSDKVHVNMDIFDNLKPVALFTVQKTGDILKIDAGSSYDQDSLYGGKITSYIYTVNGNTWSRTNSFLYHDIINGVDDYNISLVVKDNDNALSEPVNQVFSIR